MLQIIQSHNITFSVMLYYIASCLHIIYVCVCILFSVQVCMKSSKHGLAQSDLSLKASMAALASKTTALEPHPSAARKGN